uniref:Uncharacterized protein n=1 Tax=Glossina brevipalpis TaxID=37001 RepID=A0A1A9W4Y2_9MUSC
MTITMKHVQFFIFTVVAVVMFLVNLTVSETYLNEASSLHFGFETENGQQRNEHIKYDQNSLLSESTNNRKTKSLEYRGDYSFTSDDGYRYIVKYKANQNGFQPYVTAHKITRS